MINRNALQEHIIKELVAILRIVINEEQEETEGRSRRTKTIGEGLLTAGTWTAPVVKEDPKAIQSLYIQQAYSAKLLR